MLSCEFIVTIVMAYGLLLLGVLIAVVIYTNKHNKKMEELLLHQLNIGTVIDESIPKVLNLFIDDCFNDYRAKFLDPFVDGYINSDEESKIRDELIRIVSDRISEDALRKLSLFYNIENIAEVIADKIYLTVMQYVAQNNAPYMDNT